MEFRQPPPDLAKELLEFQPGKQDRKATKSFGNNDFIVFETSFRSHVCLRAVWLLNAVSGHGELTAVAARVRRVCGCGRCAGCALARTDRLRGLLASAAGARSAVELGVLCGELLSPGSSGGRPARASKIGAFGRAAGSRRPPQDHTGATGVWRGYYSRVGVTRRHSVDLGAA